MLSNDYTLPYQTTATAGVGLQLWKTTCLDIDYVHAVGRDRPAGLNITVGRSNVESAHAIVNALRAARNVAPIDASLLRPEPYVSLDMRVAKAIAVGRGRQLQLFMEGYNVTNRVNYSSSTVNGNIISTSFLIRNGASDARHLQWGLRFAFQA